MIAMISLVLPQALLVASPRISTLLTPSLHPRHGCIYAHEPANWTIGDALVGNLKRQVSKLPDSERAATLANWQLDALISSSEAELDALQLELYRKLERSEKQTAKKLRASLEETAAFYAATLNKTVTRLDSVLAPSRENIQKELKRSMEEAEQRTEDKRRKAASLAGFARASSWRTSTAVPLADMPKHPVVLLSEASALVLGLMILLVAGDMATSRHCITAPPRIANVHMQPPRLTIDYGNKMARSSAAVAASSGQFNLWPPPDEILSPPVQDYSAHRRATAPEDGLRANWWLAMRSVLAVYIGTLAVIITNGSEDWAAKALGIDLCEEMAPLQPGLVRWEYDWEREIWVEQ